MKEPPVSIIWVNYNSMEIIDVILSSLNAIRNFDYDNYELIIVDNASTDGSFQIIKDLVEKWPKPRVKIVRMDTNKGWVGACNSGYVRVKDSKYVVAMNNDLIPYTDSLRKLIEYLEHEEDVGGAQGILYNMKGEDCAGFVIDEMLRAYPLRLGEGSLRKSYPITFPIGAYAVYRVRSLRTIGRTSYLYDPELFAYNDDYILGVRLWAGGFKVKLFPVKAGLHYVGATFGKSPIQSYLLLRNYMVTVLISNSRWKYYAGIYKLAGYNMRRLIERHGLSWSAQKKALRQAYKASRSIIRREGPLDIYKAPLIRLSLHHLVLPRRIFVSKVVEYYIRKLLVEEPDKNLYS